MWHNKTTADPMAGVQKSRYHLWLDFHLHHFLIIKSRRIICLEVMKKKIKGLNKHKENKIVFVICKVCQTITLRGSLEMLINRGGERGKKDRSTNAAHAIKGVLRVWHISKFWHSFLMKILLMKHIHEIYIDIIAGIQAEIYLEELLSCQSAFPI